MNGYGNGDVDSLTREMRTLEIKAEDETPGGAVAAASEPEEKMELPRLSEMTMRLQVATRL